MGDLPLFFGMWWQKCYVHRRVPNHLRMEQQETAREITNPNPNKNDTEMLISCRMWTTSPQTKILLKASLSCTFSKTTKQWSKWSSKARVQRRDPCQEPTELRLIGFLTGSPWTPRSKSKMLTPKTNSRTCWPKVVLRVMNGTIFFDCWTAWMSRCFPAAIFFQTESRLSCLRELRKARLKKVRWWRNGDRWVWCQGTSQAQRKPLRKIRVLRTARWIKSWIRVMFHRASGNWCETTTKTQQHILKRSDKMTLYLRAPGNWCRMVNLQAQRAPGNWCEEMTMKSKGRRWNSTVCKSPTIDTLKKSQRLTLEHEAEILNVSPFGWTGPLWTRSTLTQAQTIQWTKAKIHVYSDSVLCMGMMQEHSEANKRWNDQLEEIQQSDSCRELFGIDGGPIEFEWNIFPRLTSLEILQMMQKRPAKSKHWTWEFWRTDHLHVNVQWHRRRQEIQKDVFRIPNMSRTPRRDSREDTGNS